MSTNGQFQTSNASNPLVQEESAALLAQNPAGSIASNQSGSMGPINPAFQPESADPQDMAWLEKVLFCSSVESDCSLDGWYTGTIS